MTDEALQEWCLDGAVNIHPSSGEVLELSVKLLQQHSIALSIEGGFKKDAALKTATLADQCISLCLDGHGRYVLVCSSTQCADTKATVWKLPCSDRRRIGSPMLVAAQERLHLRPFEPLVGHPEQPGAVAQSVRWGTDGGTAFSEAGGGHVIIEVDDGVEGAADLEAWRGGAMEGAITAKRQSLEEELMQRRASHGEGANHEDAVSLYELGRLCRNEGDLKAARDFFERSLRMHQELYGSIYGSIYGSMYGSV